MSFEVKITSHADEIREDMNEAIARVLERVGMQAESFAKANITQSGAVDTGNLRNSITHQVSVFSFKEAKEVYIGTAVQYAPYVEFGTGIHAETGGRQTPWVFKNPKDGRFYMTRGMKARPFLRPAVRDHIAEYKAIIEDELNK